MAEDRGENCCLRIDAERAEKAMSERPLYDLPRRGESKRAGVVFILALVRQKCASVDSSPKISHKALFPKEYRSRFFRSPIRLKDWRHQALTGQTGQL